MNSGKELFEKALENIGKQDYAEAEINLRRALYFEKRPSVLSNLAACQLKLNKFEDAVQSYKDLLELDLKDIEKLPILYNLATAFTKLGQHEDAVYTFNRAEWWAEYYKNLGGSALSTYMDILINRAISFIELKRYQEALDDLSKSYLLYPEAQKLYNIGNVHVKMLNFDKAENCFAEAVRFQRQFESAPEYVEAAWNLALSKLIQNKYEEGFKEYEIRFKRFELEEKNYHEKFIPPHIPKWNGESLAGKKILLWAEQGLGDCIMFSRFAVAGGKTFGTNYPDRICLRMPHVLKDYFKDSNFDIITPDDATPENIDYHYPLASLPYAFKTKIDSIPLPFSSSADSIIEKNSEKIIGLSWQGNPDLEKTSPNHEGRSIPLKLFEPLAEIPNVRFISLQRGFGAEQLKAVSKKFKSKFVDNYIELSKNDNILETCSQIKACDLVISIDSLVGHLGGSHGVPTWILIKKVPDWRWGINSTHTPWYSSVRLYRQEIEDDWKHVIEKIAVDIKASFGLNS